MARPFGFAELALRLGRLFLKEMARPGGFEPPASSSGGKRSIP